MYEFVQEPANHDHPPPVVKQSDRAHRTHFVFLYLASMTREQKERTS